MSSTTTIHYVCDTCGTAADIEHDGASEPPYPDGWVPSWSFVYGDFCSEPCLQTALFAKATQRAAEAFAPSPPKP